jgi:hypothetical protein
VLTLNFDDLSACVSELDIAQTFDLMRLSDIKEIDDNINKYFSFPKVWLYLLGQKKDKISSKHFRGTIVSQAHCLIGWLTLIYRHLIPDRLSTMYNNW